MAALNAAELTTAVNQSAAFGNNWQLHLFQTTRCFCCEHLTGMACHFLFCTCAGGCNKCVFPASAGLLGSAVPEQSGGCWLAAVAAAGADVIGGSCCNVGVDEWGLARGWRAEGQCGILGGEGRGI